MDSFNNTTLPILNYKNYHIFKDWHEYYFKVYRQRIQFGQEINLNTFTWFYNYAPFTNNMEYSSPIPQKLDKVSNNRLLKYNNGCAGCPEGIISEHGYFVNKQIDNTFERIDASNDEFIEVIRTNAGQGATETDIAWFYHTVGSGFWIRKENIVEIKQHIKNKKKIHLTEILMKTNGKNANDLDIDIYYGSKYDKKKVNIIYKNNIISLRD